MTIMIFLAQHWHDVQAVIIWTVTSSESIKLLTQFKLNKKDAIKIILLLITCSGPQTIICLFASGLFASEK